MMTKHVGRLFVALAVAVMLAAGCGDESVVEDAVTGAADERDADHDTVDEESNAEPADEQSGAEPADEKPGAEPADEEPGAEEATDPERDEPAEPDTGEAETVGLTFVEAVLAGDHETAVATLDETYGLSPGPGGLSPAQFWTGQTAYGPFEDSEVNCEAGSTVDTAICEAKTTDRLARTLEYRLIWDFTFTTSDGLITDIQFIPNDGTVFGALFRFARAGNPDACAPVADPTVLTDPDGEAPIGTACAQAMVASLPDFMASETYVVPTGS